jgi:hypothetical protein
MTKVKKLSWTNVGGCGGPIWRSGRRPDAKLDLRYTVNPHWDSASGKYTGGSIVISLRKPGTATVYDALASFELDVSITVEQARELCQLHFELSANNYEYTEEEQKIVDAYEALMTAKQEEQYDLATQNLVSLPIITDHHLYRTLSTAIVVVAPRTGSDQESIAERTARAVHNRTQGRVREILAMSSDGTE